MDEKKPIYKQFASDNRKNMPPAEKHLWYDFLRPHKMKFVRQKRLDQYIVDFYCHEARLVIELDGKQHFTEEAHQYDTNRTAEIERHGIKVIRYSNQQIFDYFEAVTQDIERILEERLRIVDKKYPKKDKL